MNPRFTVTRRRSWQPHAHIPLLWLDPIHNSSRLDYIRRFGDTIIYVPLMPPSSRSHLSSMTVPTHQRPITLRAAASASKRGNWSAYSVQ